MCVAYLYVKYTSGLFTLQHFENTAVKRGASTGCNSYEYLCTAMRLGMYWQLLCPPKKPVNLQRSVKGTSLAKEEGVAIMGRTRMTVPTDRTGVYA
jgi:hypothetical protein